MSRVGFIGTGHIAAPMARVLARDGHAVAVSKRNAEVADGLAASGLGITVASNQKVIDGSDVVFLCLRPAVWAQVLGGLVWRTEHKIVSVMAGVALADIARICAPVSEFSATIPFGFIEQGGCPLPVAGDPSVIKALFGAKNPVLAQRDEAALVSHFAASALPSGVLHMLEVASEWLAVQTGDAGKAEVYVGNLISGILHNLDKSEPGFIAAERAALASPKTLNLQMVEGLQAQSVFDGLPDLLDGISRSMTK